MFRRAGIFVRDVRRARPCRARDVVALGCIRVKTHTGWDNLDGQSARTRDRSLEKSAGGGPGARGTATADLYREAATPAHRDRAWRPRARGGAGRAARPRRFPPPAAPAPWPGL